MTTKDDIRLDFSKYTGTYSIKTKLDKNQRICASHIKGYHILMTKK